MQHYSDTDLRCCVFASELECHIIVTLTSDVLPTELDHSIIVTLTYDAEFCPVN